MSAAVFRQASGERFEAGELARGPWDREAQHGGAPAALLMRAFEQLPAAPGLAISRVTYEFMRPVPIGPLTVDAEVVRAGRKVQLLEASIAGPSGLEVVRARGLQVRRADSAVPRAPEPPPPPGPEQGRENEFASPYRPMFAPDAIEIRFVDGT